MQIDVTSNQRSNAGLIEEKFVLLSEATFLVSNAENLKTDNPIRIQVGPA